MIFTFFVFWGVWFWILFGILVLAEICFLENDNGYGATSSLFVFALLLMLFGDWNPFPAMAADPFWVIQLIAMYIGAGTVWSVVKWYFHGLNVLDDFRETKKRFFNQQDIPEGGKIPKDKIDRWEGLVERTYPTGIPPRAKENKATCLMWMTHWPFSMLWTIINDPFRRIFLFIYSRLTNMMQKISDHTFKDEKVEYDD